MINATAPSATAGNTLLALTDHLRSIRDLIDNNGVIREHNVYDSFGRLIREVNYNTAGAVIASNDSAAVDTIFGYTGRDFDSDTGLQYNRARWYDPQTGRWLSQAPIGFAAGDANLYRYVGNRATTAADPSGLVDLTPDENLSKKYEYCNLDTWEGSKNGRTGTYYQWSYYNRSFFMKGDGVAGPILFEPDPINGISINSGIIGSRSKHAAIQQFANGTQECADGAGEVIAAGFFIGSLFVPGPEDVVLAYIGARYGISIVRGAIYQNGEVLTGQAAKEAEALLVKSGNEIIDAANKANEISKMSTASRHAGQIYKCVEYADDFIKKLQKAGIHGDRLTFKSSTDFGIWSNSLGRSLTQTGNHTAVRVGDKIYDNMRPNGFPYKDWIDDHEIVGNNKTPISTPF